MSLPGRSAILETSEPLPAPTPEPGQFLLLRLLQSGDEGFITLKKQALREGLGPLTSKDRAIAWKTFLGFHTTPARKDQWLLEANVHRKRYEVLKNKHKNHATETDHPLSSQKDSPWFKHFQREQLAKTILQDVERTYPEEEFFHSETIKNIMMDVLFVYTSEYSDLSYRQGMHELLAVVIYVIHQGVVPLSDSPLVDDDARLLSSPEYVEHDSFAVFEKIMKTTSDWFITKQPKSSTAADSEQSPIIVKCRRIYHDVLRTRDPELHAYMTFLAIEPQVYLLRWVRLLFSREFNLEETLTLWDGIFGYDKAHSLIDYIAVSMLISIKPQLLSNDSNGVLSLLFKYPSKSVAGGICGLLERARLLLKQRTIGESFEKSVTKFVNKISTTQGELTQAVQSSLSALQAPPSDPGASKSADSRRRLLNRAQAPTSGNSTAPSNSLAPVGLTASGVERRGVPTSPDSLHSQRPFTQVLVVPIDENEALKQNVAKHLKSIIETLQPILFDPANTAVPDEALISLAQLKAIKDVLIGHLPPDALPQL